MPSTTPKRKARWPGSCEQAVKFLKDSGYKTVDNFDWRGAGRPPTARELDALVYLQEEWDWGGLVERTYGPSEDGDLDCPFCRFTNDAYLKGFEDAREVAAKEVDTLCFDCAGSRAISVNIRAMKPKDGE